MKPVFLGRDMDADLHEALIGVPRFYDGRIELEQIDVQPVFGNERQRSRPQVSRLAMLRLGPAAVRRTCEMIHRPHQQYHVKRRIFESRQVHRVSVNEIRYLNACFFGFEASQVNIANRSKG